MRFEGRDLLSAGHGEMRRLRRDMQIIFQDPFGSLDPRMNVEDIISEPLVIHEKMDASARRARLSELLGAVGLDASVLKRFPHEFSGGQRQRIGIARALALRPKFIVADEPVSALDVSVGAQIVNLLSQLQREFGLTYLFISHSMPVVRYLATRIAVMYRGKVVEVGDTQADYGTAGAPVYAQLAGSHPGDCGVICSDSVGVCVGPGLRPGRVVHSTAATVGSAVKTAALCGTPALHQLGYPCTAFGGHMKLHLAVLLLSVAAFAQQSKNPVTDVLRDSLAGRQKNTVGAIEEMPADKFGYKPTPDQMSFGHLAAHIVEANYFFCSKVGDVPQPKVEELTEASGKEKLVAGAKASFDFCATALAKAEDSKLGDTIKDFAGHDRPRAWAALALAGSWADHYGAAAMYLRLNGLLPPSAQKKPEETKK